jgi:hypothetical protein
LPEPLATDRLLAETFGSPAQSYVGNAGQGQSRPEGPASDVDGRIAETPMQLMYADAGISADGSAAYADSALLFGSQRGTDLAVVLNSAQVGEQTEAQSTLFSMSASSSDGSTTATIRDLSLTVGGGVHNPDGSTGVNLKADATILAAQLEQDLGDGDRLTLGLHLGVGVEGSVGTSDVDGDDYAEYCLRASAFGVTAGGCLELGRVAETVLASARDALKSE